MEEKKEKKLHISMRTFLMITMLGVILLVAVGTAVGILYFTRKNSSDRLLDTTEEQAERLADQIALHRFRIESPENTLAADIDETAFLAGGRILVIDRNYRIVKDTFSFQQEVLPVNCPSVLSPFSRNPISSVRISCLL